MMKAKEAHSLLAQYESGKLYQQACRLYREESDSRITLRAYGKKPSRNTVEGVVSEMKDWFRKVAESLAWENSGTPEDIIKWESSAIYVRHSILDPKIEDYGKRTRLEILKGTSLPLLEAMRPGDLDAVTGMMMAKIQKDVCEYVALKERRDEYAKQLGVPICPHGVAERFCPHQKTYSMAQPLPTSVDDLVFVCTVNKCIKESG